MNKMGKRVHSIEALRFLLMLLVAVWHFDSGMGQMQHGYLAVDVFFILSGFFLYRSATKREAANSLDYTWNKVKRFYPETIVVLVPLLVISWSRVLKEPHRLLNDLFFVTSSSVFGGGWNAPLWFLHIMILSGALLYPLCKNWPRISIPALLPSVFLFPMTYLLNIGDGRLECSGVIGPFDCSLLRGLSEMSLGILAAVFWERKGNSIMDSKEGQWLVNILSLVGILGVITLVFIHPDYDRYVLLFAVFVIIGCMDSRCILNKLPWPRLWDYLGSLSFEIYLVHFAIMKVLVRYLGNGYDGWLFTAYLVAVFLTAMILRWFCIRVLKINVAR